MENLTLPERNELRKSYLKNLPIWEDIKKDVGVFLDQMEFEVKTYSENFQRISDIVESFPKLSTDGRRKVHPCRQHLNKDIVKLYSRNNLGEIVIEDVNDSDNIETLQKVLMKTNTTKTSIDLLRSKPCNGDLVFAKVNEDGPWAKCRIKCVFHRSVNGRPMTTFKLEVLENNRTVSVGKFEVARIQNHGDQLRAPKRVVAGVDETSMEPGIIAQDPCEENKKRYMVFLDKGTCQYFKPDQVFPIFYQSPIPWKDLQQLGRRDTHFEAELNHFFKNFPKRFLTVVNAGEKIELSRNGLFVPAVVIKIDCDVMEIVYKDRVEQSIHRWCPRLVQSRLQTSTLLRNSIDCKKLAPKLRANMIRYHDAGAMALGEDYLKFIENFQSSVTICGSNTARKSTAARSEPPRLRVKLDERAVNDDRDLLPFLRDLMANQVKHNCNPDCLIRPGVRTEADVNDIIAEFRDTCDLKVPLLLGWKRQMVKTLTKNGKNTNKQFIYESPCGKIFKSFYQVMQYIRQTGSKLDIDYFTFEKEIILNRQLGERYAYHFVDNIAVSKTGQILENKYISLFNPISEERLPIDFEYRSDTFPHPMLRAKGFSFNEEFKSGCDCEDDCFTRASCACHRLTEQAAGVTAHNRGSIDKKCQYMGKRLAQQVSTGIFECNSFCKCSSKCPNRVVQNGIRIRMQVRKTIDKGWGVFVLDDVPKGSFICTYSAELLDDADQYGDSDMYYADLDYITIVEHQKLDLASDDERSDEGLEADYGDDEDEVKTQKPKSKSLKRPMIHESDESSDDASAPSQDEYMPQAVDRYPRRNRTTTQKDARINQKPQFRKIHSILNESQDYTLDARMQGNIGRFFNHSCDPNSMVQNVFIETHDLRFPVVAFFTKRDLKADDEINWHYNYKIDSIAGRQISCNCGASNCMGRIL